MAGENFHLIFLRIPPLSAPILLLLLPLLLLVFLKYKATSRTSNNIPPGPAKLPIIGNFHQLSSLLHQSLWKLSKKHGPLMTLHLGRVPTLVVSSAKMAEEVLKIQDLEFCSRPNLVAYRTLSYDFKDIVFAPYGEHWRQLRKISTIELFSSKRVQSFSSIREEEVENMIATLSRSACETGAVVNLSELFLSLSNNVTCRVALGKSYQTGEGEKARIGRLVADVQGMFTLFFAADYFPLGRWMDVATGKMARLRRKYLELDGFYEEVIEEHLDPKRDQKMKKEDFMDVLLRVQKDLNLTRDYVKGVLMNIFIAGTDTSSATLTWTMAELMRNTGAMEKAQQEVRRVVGRKGKVKEGHIQQLDYLKQVLKETLRLHPPAPLLVPHHTIRECTISGCKIPANTRILVSAFAIGRDPLSWENPEEFLPERFSDSSIDYKGQDFELLPFGAGRRMCPGMNLGIVIVELALANLLYSFNWELPCGMKKEEMDMGEAPGIAVHKKSPLILVPTSTENY